MSSTKDLTKLRNYPEAYSGSFWSDYGEELAAQANGVASAVPYDELAHKAVANIHGRTLSSPTLYVGSYAVEFDPSAVLVEGMKATTEIVNPDTGTSIAVTSTDNYVSLITDDDGSLLTVGGSIITHETEYGTFHEMVFMVPFDAEVFPLCIQANGRELLAGIDFTVRGDVLEFYEPPTKLFPDRVIRVESGLRVETNNVLDFQTQTAGTITHTWARKIQGGDSTASSFLRAVKESLGFVVVGEDVEIYSYRAMVVGYQYLTSVGEIQAPYYHKPLPGGTILNAGDAIHDGVSAFASTEYADLVPHLDLGKTVILDFILPVEGINFSSRRIGVMYTGRVAGTPQAVYGLSEHLDGAKDAWFSLLRNRESETGVMLHDEIYTHYGVSSDVVGSTVEFGELLYDVFREFAIIDISNGSYDDEQIERMLQFVRRERPLRSNVLVLR